MQVNINIPDSRLQMISKVLRITGCVVCAFLLFFINDPNSQTLINLNFVAFILIPLLALTLNLLLASLHSVFKRHWVQVICWIAVLQLVHSLYLFYQNINITFEDLFFQENFLRLSIGLLLQIGATFVIPLVGYALLRLLRKKSQ